MAARPWASNPSSIHPWWYLPAPASIARPSPPRTVRTQTAHRWDEHLDVMPAPRNSRINPSAVASFLLLRAQKKKQEKGTPTSPGPAGFPYFSTRAGRGKTRASPSNSSRVFSAPACEARQDKWGGRGKSHCHAAEHRRGCRKGDLHCLRRSRVCKAPAASRSAGYPASGGTRDTGCPFFGSFLWASKEMNRRINVFLWLRGMIANQIFSQESTEVKTTLCRV